MSRTLVTPHFALEEFAQPARHGWRVTVPYPTAWIPSRLLPLCQALEWLRAALGGLPFTILNGYRSPEYNRKVRGAKASQHLTGRAADFRVAGVQAALVHAKALELYERGELLIGGLAFHARQDFVHLDVRRGGHLARWTYASEDGPDL